MKIIKRNGTEVPFDITKIIVAVSKANQSVDEKLRLSREQITQIAAAVSSSATTKRASRKTPTRTPPSTASSGTIWPARSPRT